MGEGEVEEIGGWEGGRLQKWKSVEGGGQLNHPSHPQQQTTSQQFTQSHPSIFNNSIPPISIPLLPTLTTLPGFAQQGDGQGGCGAGHRGRHHHLRRGPVSHSTWPLQHQGVAWCGVVWCGVVWRDVVWCGVVWRGVA